MVPFFLRLSLMLCIGALLHPRKVLIAHYTHQEAPPFCHNSPRPRSADFAPAQLSQSNITAALHRRLSLNFLDRDTKSQGDGSIPLELGRPGRACGKADLWVVQCSPSAYEIGFNAAARCNSCVSMPVVSLPRNAF